MPQLLWRCFPWNPEARPGEPFSPSYLAPGQTTGRFDLRDAPPVRYFAASPEHAIGEILAAFRGTSFVPAYLRQYDHQLALTAVRLTDALVARIANLSDPATLLAHGLGPDTLAHHDRTQTQAIARALHSGSQGHSPLAGLRWWSSLTGAWHTTVVFTDRVAPDEIQFERPSLVSLDEAALSGALRVLGISH